MAVAIHSQEQNIEREIVTVQWRNLADAVLARLSRLISRLIVISIVVSS